MKFLYFPRKKSRELPLVLVHLFLIANNQDKLRLIWQGRIRFSRPTTSGNGILTSVGRCEWNRIMGNVAEGNDYLMKSEIRLHSYVGACVRREEARQNWI